MQTNEQIEYMLALLAQIAEAQKASAAALEEIAINTRELT
jgi:DNA-binding IscR family transcriptional regulator